MWRFILYILLDFEGLNNEYDKEIIKIGIDKVYRLCCKQSVHSTRQEYERRYTLDE